MNSNGVKLLVLDGGDLRALSQIRILEEFMRRVNHERAHPLVPCDYFDMICGSGTGGLIAILLVVFRLSAEEALERYYRIYHAVGGSQHAIRGSRPEERTERLKGAIHDLFIASNLPQDERLLRHNYRSDNCLLVVFVASMADISVCRKLMNYVSREQSTLNPTIVDAIRAVVAFPGLFDPVSIGTTTREEQFISCKFFFNNPTKQALQEAKPYFGPGRQVAAIVSLGCGKALPPSISSTLNEADYVELLEIVATDSEKVSEDMERLIGQSNYTHRRVYFRFSVDRILDESGDQRLVGKIISNTLGYLVKEQTGRSLDECVSACEIPGHATLGDLTHFREHFVMTNGLPPLPEWTVTRREEMKQMEINIFRRCPGRPIVVVSGMPGSGKTQLVNKFIRDFLPRLPIAIWIDGSSEQTIRSSMIARVNELGRKCETLEQARSSLAQWNETQEGPWIIVFDNLDNPSIRLKPYFPPGDTGYIIVTTRDERRGSLSPSAHLKLRPMSRTDAIQVFINAAFLGREITMDEGLEAEKIVDELGRLPLAVHQAGCYVRQRNCLKDYLNRLHENRPIILARRVQEEQDGYNHSVHDVFHVTVGSLPKRAKEFLSLLSCAHHTNFPQSLIRLAADHQFRLDTCELVERNEEQTPELGTLYSIFSPNHQWNSDDFDDLVEELQIASLITRVPAGDHILFDMHPLLHSWVNYQLPSKQKQEYQAAMARLLSCGAGAAGAHLHEYMISHIIALKKYWSNVHVNDRASFADLLAFPGIADDTVTIWESVHEELRNRSGKRSSPVLYVTGRLAWAYEVQGDLKRAEHTRETEALLKRELFPSDYNHSHRIPTSGAIQTDGNAALVEGLAQLNLSESSDPESFLERKVLDQLRNPERLFDPELQSRLVRDPAMKHAALTLAGRYEENIMNEEAEILGSELVRARTERNASRNEVVHAQEYLAGVYERQRKYEMAIPLRRAAYEYRRELDRTMASSSGLPQAVRHLASNYAALYRYREARDLLRGQTSHNYLYLSDLEQLVITCETTGYIDEAEDIRADIELLRRPSQISTPITTYQARPYQPSQSVQAVVQMRQGVLSGDTFAMSGDARRHLPDDRNVGGYVNAPASTRRGASIHPSQPSLQVHMSLAATSNWTLPQLTTSPVGELPSLEEQAAAFERQGNMSRAAAIRREIAQGEIARQ